jgi:hypothetical protein
LLRLPAFLFLSEYLIHKPAYLYSAHISPEFQMNRQCLHPSVYYHFFWPMRNFGISGNLLFAYFTFYCYCLCRLIKMISIKSLQIINNFSCLSIFNPVSKLCLLNHYSMYLIYCFPVQNHKKADWYR